MSDNILVALIPEHFNFTCTCNFELSSSLQISADDFVKLSDAMGFSKGVQIQIE